MQGLMLCLTWLCVEVCGFTAGCIFLCVAGLFTQDWIFMGFALFWFLGRDQFIVEQKRFRK